MSQVQAFEMIITAHMDGTVEVEMSQVQGPACEKVVEELIDGLGEELEHEHTADYHKRPMIAGQVKTRRTLHG